MALVLVEVDGSEVLQDYDIVLPQYSIGDVVGYYVGADSKSPPVEAVVIGISTEKMVFEGESVEQIVYRLDDGQSVEEENIDYIAGDA